VVKRDGGGNRLVYQRKPLGKPNQYEWIVHETWNPARGTGVPPVARQAAEATGGTPVPRREIFTATWPNGCIGIDIDTGAVRQVCSFNAWHPSINRQGTLMCTDTTFPDIGLQLFDPRDGVGDPRPLCFPEASSEGRHWDTDHCPYDDEDYQQGKWTVYAPQHTHPHPAFSPDGKHVVFTSDRTGHAQVYEVTLPA
jgi:oligogalacturonide lyase